MTSSKANPKRATETASRIDRLRVNKFDERRGELAEAALQTLAELGYARTSLREIAQKSDFTHGVLHYYFRDKTDLMCASVRYYKTTCATRYDDIVSKAKTPDELLEGFLARLAETLHSEGHMHRLWYDIRAQALYEEAFRDDVKEIDKKLADMTWRVAARYAELAGTTAKLPRSVLYALMDGIFQKYLLESLAGDTTAADRLVAEVRPLFAMIA